MIHIDHKQTEPSKLPFFTVTDEKRLEQELIVTAIALAVLVTISFVLATFLNSTFYQLVTAAHMPTVNYFIFYTILGAIGLAAIKGIKAALYVRPEVPTRPKIAIPWEGNPRPPLYHSESDDSARNSEDESPFWS